MKIDKAALEDLIIDTLNLVEGSRHIESETICIAEIYGVQVQLIITKNEDDFLPEIVDGIIEE